jgi:hypothetical protein
MFAEINIFLIIIIVVVFDTTVTDFCLLIIGRFGCKVRRQRWSDFVVIIV